MRTVKRSLSLFVMLALVLAAVPALAETTNCTAITSLPATISSSGVYCFTGNLSTSITSGYAVSIQANNVVLDLNGFAVDGTGGGSSTGATGIYANARKNITLKNGIVRGFLYGIQLWDDANVSQGHVVEDILAELNTYSGMVVRGTGNVVRNNRVVATGINPNTPGSIGIYIVGTGPRVLNNDVVNMLKQSGGTASAIVFDYVTGGLAVGNRITSADYGVHYYSGSTGKYRDNVTSGVTTPFSGGTDGGDNN